MVRLVNSTSLCLPLVAFALSKSTLQLIKQGPLLICQNGKYGHLQLF